MEGSLDRSADSVYILCENADYEAFLLRDGGFAAYIPADAEVTGVGAYSDIA